MSYFKTVRERVLYRYGLRHADRIIVQTRRQHTMLLEGFGLDSVVLPTPCAGPAESDYVPHDVPNGESFRILWIGRISEPKRLDRLLDLARKCPEWQIDLAGPPDNNEYGRRMYEEAKKVPNITVHGLVGRDRLPEFFKRAACLCCTSAREGFPNTFLEAWSHGLPVVSTFDPDGLIATRGLGVAADDVPGLIAGIRGLVSSPERYRRASDSARRYFVENHMFDGAMGRFERVFLDVAGGVDRPGRRPWSRDHTA
jgi:glycosyltransferase involved in cell wall biosynthesis